MFSFELCCNVFGHSYLDHGPTSHNIEVDLYQTSVYQNLLKYVKSCMSYCSITTNRQTYIRFGCGIRSLNQLLPWVYFFWEVHIIQRRCKHSCVHIISFCQWMLGMRRYGHHTIRYVSIRREAIWLFSIRYDTDNNCINTNIHNIHILSFMNTTEVFFD